MRNKKHNYLKNKNKKHFRNKKRTQKYSLFSSLKYKVRRFSKYNKIKFSFICWLILILTISMIFWIIYGFDLSIKDALIFYLTLFTILFSVIIGMYVSYRSIRNIEKKFFIYDDFSIWLRRVISIAMTVIGAVFLVISITYFGFLLFVFNLSYTFNPSNSSYSISDFIISNIMGIFLGISLGLLILSLYIEFTFERNAGVIIFGGKQRF